MLSGNLWPIHLKPYKNELLSSWLVRIAHAHGLKVQSFYHLEFGSQREIWNRDIDRLAPDWLLQRLHVRTSLNLETIYNTTLQSYKNKLFSTYRSAGSLTWIQTLKIYHRTRHSYGLQFCPLCLKEDKEPYFRKSWRLSLYTFCPYHNVSMHEQCPCCASPIVFYRQELGKPESYDFKPLSICWKCDFNLAESPVKDIDVTDKELVYKWQKLLLKIDKQLPFSQHAQDKLKILHHLCAIIISKSLAPKLSEYLEKKTKNRLDLQSIQTNSIEGSNLSTRKTLIFYGFWLMEHFPNRIVTAWKDKAIRYNHLTKDFESCPIFFKNKISILNRRNRRKNNFFNPFFIYNGTMDAN